MPPPAAFGAQHSGEPDVEFSILAFVASANEAAIRRAIVFRPGVFERDPPFTSITMPERSPRKPS
jgi:hypothetical protein